MSTLANPQSFSLGIAKKQNIDLANIQPGDCSWLWQNLPTLRHDFGRIKGRPGHDKNRPELVFSMKIASDQSVHNLVRRFEDAGVEITDRKSGASDNLQVTLRMRYENFSGVVKAIEEIMAPKPWIYGF